MPEPEPQVYIGPRTTRASHVGVELRESPARCAACSGSEGGAGAFSGEFTGNNTPCHAWERGIGPCRDHAVSMQTPAPVPRMCAALWVEMEVKTLLVGLRVGQTVGALPQSNLKTPLRYP
jgi:hypothetical protein